MPIALLYILIREDTTGSLLLVKFLTIRTHFREIHSVQVLSRESPRARSSDRVDHRHTSPRTIDFIAALFISSF